MDILSYFLTSLIAAVLGGAAMEMALWLIGMVGWAHANMIVALGSLLTGKKEGARRTGMIVHVVVAIVFALIYVAAMMKLGLTTLPASLGLGAGFGLAQGIIVSLGLVWVVADHHPLDEFRGADLAIGLSHIVGHLAFGLVVGLVVGISPV